MLKINARSEYALILVQFLLNRPAQKHSLMNLSSTLGIPEPVLRKVSNTLEKNGIIRSHQGRAGGVEIGKKDISVYEVLSAMDEDLSLVLCTQGSECSKQGTCNISPTLTRIQRWMEALLKITKL